MNQSVSSARGWAAPALSPGRPRPRGRRQSGLSSRTLLAHRGTQLLRAVEPLPRPTDYLSTAPSPNMRCACVAEARIGRRPLARASAARAAHEQAPPRTGLTIGSCLEATEATARAQPRTRPCNCPQRSHHSSQERQGYSANKRQNEGRAVVPTHALRMIPCSHSLIYIGE